MPKITFRRGLEKPKPGPPGAKGDSGAAGPRGAKGDRGAPGSTGAQGEKGDDGRSAYEVWLAKGNTGTERAFLKSLKGKEGKKGRMGAGGSDGPRGAPGPPGEAPAPVSTALTRDAEDRVATITPEGRPTWTISRNPDGSVASITDGETDVAVDRDAEDRVEGITVT